MYKRNISGSMALSLVMGLILSFLYAACFADESLTITTYYPSPYGSYSQLTADQIAIGSGYRNPTYADGSLYVQGNVGIGTTGPGSKLTVKADTNDGISLEKVGISGSRGLFYIGPYNEGNITLNSELGIPEVHLTGLNGGNNYFLNSRFGIGTNNPQEIVDISSGNLLINGGDTYPGSGIKMQYANAGNLFKIRPINGGALVIGEYANDTGEQYPLIIYASAPAGVANVGIGVTAPQARLDVRRSDNSAGDAIAFGTQSYYMGRLGEDASTNVVYLANTYNSDTSGIDFRLEGTAAANSKMFIKGNGNVGIGVTNPSYQLQLSTDSAAKSGTNTWTIASDIRIKKDIRPYTNGLSIIKRINPVWFKYNGKAGLPLDNQNHIGVIGQEIVKVAPYTVNTFKAKLNPEDKKETELLNFNSHALTFNLINSVKELDANITKLSKELKSELENLKTRLSRLEARVK